MANPRKRRSGDGSTRSPVKLPDAAVVGEPAKPRSAVLPGVALAAGAILFLFLLRFAVDILMWVVVLALFALVLHVFTQWLAESELLSAPWLLIIVLTVGGATWMLWPGSSFQEGLDVAHYLPTPFVKALEWAERRSLTRRALVASPAPSESGSAGSLDAAPAPSAAADPGFTASVGSIVLTVVPAASRVGEPVTFRASLGGRAQAGFAGPVQFFDGGVLIGEGTLRSAGLSRSASLTTAGLSVGTHRITARYAGAVSDVLVHTVAGG